MAETTVSLQDVQDSARFIREFVATSRPDLDLTEGTMLSDTVESLAYIVAMMRQWRNTLRDRSSLLTLGNLPDDEDVTDAANAILANWFFPRPQGTYARGVATVHVSQRTDLLIQRTTRFTKSSSLVYVLDSAADLFVPQSALRPSIDTNGQVVDWAYAQVPIVAMSTGERYNQTNPGRFMAYDRFNTFVTYIEHQASISGGNSQAATADYITQGRNALSLRAMVNARSNLAVLTQQFADLSKVITVGAGDPEMVRDLLTEIGRPMRLHLGGHVDIYGRLPLQEVTETLTVGGSFVRNDGKVVILRDDGRDFPAAGVVVGDVLNIISGLPEAPYQFVVSAVRYGELEVSARTPFSVASDEDIAADVITYTIGDNYPLFNNRVAGPAFAPITSAGGTSRTMSTTGQVFLLGRPVYRVKSVTIKSPSMVLSPWMNSGDDIVFNQRVMTAPPVGVAGRALPYQVVVLDSNYGQSALGMTGIKIGWDGHPFDEETLTVIYDTAVGFESLDAFVRGEQTRVSNANALSKAFHPVYVAFQVPYTITSDQDVLSLTTGTQNFDDVAGARTLEAFVTNYKYGDALDYSRLATEVRKLSPLLGVVDAFPISYEFFAPDGRVARYSTTGALTLFADVNANGAQLLNATELGFSTNYVNELAQWLSEMGISARLLRYVAPTGSVTFIRRG